MSISEKFDHIRVNIANLPCFGVEDQDSIPGCFEEAPVSHLGCAQGLVDLGLTLLKVRIRACSLGLSLA